MMSLQTHHFSIPVTSNISVLGIKPLYIKSMNIFRDPVLRDIFRHFQKLHSDGFFGKPLIENMLQKKYTPNMFSQPSCRSRANTDRSALNSCIPDLDDISGVVLIQGQKAWKACLFTDYFSAVQQPFPSKANQFDKLIGTFFCSSKAGVNSLHQNVRSNVINKMINKAEFQVSYNFILLNFCSI